jgi:hypothetical protein
MAELESAHGKLSAVDQKYTAQRYLALLFGTLIVALIIIYFIAGVKSGDFVWNPLAHDWAQHALETSTF